MSHHSVLITGGAGFVGSNLALRFRRDLPEARIVAFDNLRRRGSELNLPRLREAGVDFVHGDIRQPEDLTDAGAFDLLVECSAEPSVHAGYDGSPAYLLDTNLVGTLHCLEAARRQGADVLFLSTSRVYPIRPVRELPLRREGERLVIPPDAAGTGWSERGISTDFPLAGGRSLYGASKLCSELVIQEYVDMYGMRAVIDRCGVLTGPWQMGKVDQGFFVLWAARHLYGGSLGYHGFGGHGHQVRDVLHVDDLYRLLRLQLDDLDRHSGRVYNVGGGPEVSVSLAELTALCAERTGRTLEMARRPETSPADIPYYVSDLAAVSEATGWAPSAGVEEILDEVLEWLGTHRETLEPILS